MFKKQLILAAVLLLTTSHAHSYTSAKDQKKKKPTQTANKEELKSETKNISSQAGLNIPEWGITIDAIYDPRLDSIIPGKHIVSIILTNKRPDPISLSADKDKWVIVDSKGHKHTASNHVEHFDKNLWDQLPAKLKSILHYPRILNAGKSITIDVFIPISAHLTDFKEVIWKSDFFKKEFNIYTNYENTLSISPPREFDIKKSEETDIMVNQMESLEEHMKSAPEIDSVNMKDFKNNEPQKPKIEESKPIKTDFDDSIVIE